MTEDFCAGDLEETLPKLRKKMVEIHKLIIEGLLCDELTHTSKKCNYHLRSELFNLACHCYHDLTYGLDAQYEWSLNQLKNFVEEAKKVQEKKEQSENG